MARFYFDFEDQLPDGDGVELPSPEHAAKEARRVLCEIGADMKDGDGPLFLRVRVRDEAGRPIMSLALQIAPEA